MIEILKFGADWCAPCKSMEPHFNRFVSQTGVPYRAIDADGEPATLQQYGVRSVPTTIFLKNGKVVKSLVGAQTYDQLLFTYNSLK